MSRTLMNALIEHADQRGASLNLTEFSPHPDSGDVLRCNKNLVTAIAGEVTSLTVPTINLYRAQAE